MVLDANWFADSLVSKIDFNFTSLVNA
jgi:hypothetical protein